MQSFEGDQSSVSSPTVGSLSPAPRELTQSFGSHRHLHSCMCAYTAEKLSWVTEVVAHTFTPSIHGAETGGSL